MSLWGNYDAKPRTDGGSGTVAINGTTGAVTGSSTKLATDFAVGDFIHVGENDYVFTAIASETAATVVSATGGALKGASANASYVVSEKPLSIKYSQNIDADTVYGVATEEMEGNAGVGSIAVATAGTGFTVRPTISFTGGGGSGATATAVGTVVSIAIGDVAGDDYSNGDIITVTGGTGTSATATVTTGENDNIPTSLTLVSGGSYTALPSLDEAATTNDGGGDDTLTVDLVIGLGDVTVTASGNNYSSAPTVVVGGAGGTDATATATLQSTEAGSVVHAGWVVRTVGTGGRAGRVQYETLVAMSSIQSDAEDDAQLPE
jgi:hypothetical protein